MNDPSHQEIIITPLCGLIIPENLYLNGLRIGPEPYLQFNNLLTWKITALINYSYSYSYSYSMPFHMAGVTFLDVFLLFILPFYIGLLLYIHPN